MSYANAPTKTIQQKVVDIKKYTRGARCTFPNFRCPSKCGFKEGIDLSRKI